MSTTVGPLAYTVADAAEACHLSQATIRDAINHGQLKAKRAGTKLLILADDLRDWLTALPAARD